MAEFRNIRKDEWLYAWHYARYDRRHNQIAEHVGPLLRQAAKTVMRQGRDMLAVRAAMQRSCSPRTAFLYTARVGFLKNLNRA
jgi:hypothetical protein